MPSGGHWQALAPIVIALLLAIYQTGLIPEIAKKTTSLTTFDVVDHDRDKGGDKPAASDVIPTKGQGQNQ